MGQAFNAFFAFIIQLFTAAEKGASALNNVATWADESTGQFVDDARHTRAMKLKGMQKEQIAADKDNKSTAKAAA